MLRLNEGRKLPGLLMGRSVRDFLLGVDILFILYRLLFLLLRMILGELGMGVGVRILCCLVVGMLCLVRLVLAGLSSCQSRR
jgi:hypothetical protein